MKIVGDKRGRKKEIDLQTFRDHGDTVQYFTGLTDLQLCQYSFTF